MWVLLLGLLIESGGPVVGEVGGLFKAVVEPVTPTLLTEVLSYRNKLL
jgi:hypothetical protein